MLALVVFTVYGSNDSGVARVRNVCCFLSSTLQIVTNLQDLECGDFCVTETNINWTRPASKLASIACQKMFKQLHLLTASSALGAFHKHKDNCHLPGGAAVFTFDHWATKPLNQARICNILDNKPTLNMAAETSLDSNN